METINALDMDSINDFSPEAVIIDAGTLPDNNLALQWLDRCSRIVCCDGAADGYLASGRVPWRVVGDGDSVSDAVRLAFAGIIRCFPDQDTNDQTKAVKYLAAKGIKRMVILAATGKREDHTIGNISLLIDYMEKGIEARIYTDYGVFIPVSGTRSFSCRSGSQVSIFNFGATGLRAEGLRYPIRDFKSWWEGTLNQTLSPEFTIHAKGNYLVFINYYHI